MPETKPDPGLAPLPDQLVAEVIDTPEGVQCTIYPEHADDVDLVTTWITAADGSFVDLAEMR